MKLSKIIWAVIVPAILAGVFFFSGCSLNPQKTIPETEVFQKAPIEEEPLKEVAPSKETTDAPVTEEVAAKPQKEAPKEEEPEKTVEENICTLTIRCDTILNNLEKLNENKKSLVPENGIILDKIKVSFNEGESVFNILRRETKRNKIHLEFSNTPLYNSAYIEGIGNLYEFDVGELSGWTYKVNSVSPRQSSSEYIIKNGDEIEWLYTCDLGRDVGANTQISE